MPDTPPTIIALENCAMHPCDVEKASWQGQQQGPRDALREVEVHLLPEQRFQRFEGIGGAFSEIGGAALEALDTATREKVLEALFGDTGARLNYCRLPIGASDFALDAYSLAETPEDYDMAGFDIDRDRRHLLPFARAARALRPELRLHASPWSPPAWMKTNRSITEGGSLRDEPRILEAYALYFLRFVEAYAREGLHIDIVFAQNEGDVATPYPSCDMPAPQMQRFLRDHLRPLFDRAGVDTRIGAGTFHTLNTPHMLRTLADPGLREAVDAVGVQYSFAEALHDIRQIYPELPLLHTESHCYDGANSDEAALALWFDFVRCVQAGCVNYSYWNLILDERQESSWGWKQNSLATIDLRCGGVTWNPDFHVLKTIGQLVRPGAHRIATHCRFCRTVGFENPDGSVVLMLYNGNPQTLTAQVRCRNEKLNWQVPGGAVCGRIV